MSKEKNNWGIWVGLLSVSAVVILIVAIILNGMKGQSSGDLQIDGSAKVTGLVCRDTVQIHPAVANTSSESHQNTITANFNNDKLSSISLLYEGDYGTEAKAKSAETLGLSDYNEILVKKYGEHIDIFSQNFSVNGSKMQLVQTTRDINRITTNTAEYFLLDQGTKIAKTREELKRQYEAKGFSCEISD